MSHALFICETCGGVTLGDCPECPARTGATVGDMLDALRRCAKHGEITDCRAHYGRHIATLKRSTTADAKAMALQIENMVRYRRMIINGEHND